MKNLILILLYFFYSTYGRTISPDECENCSGKLHTHEDLELAKQALIINKEKICVNEKYKFFIIVKSGNFQRRMLTRTTWGDEMTLHFNIPILYAIGYPNDSSVQKDIYSEDEKYKDLLQFNITESYFNLTIKTTSVLYWYNKYCSNNSEYLLYVDDDILIHTDKLYMYINQLNSVNYNNTIEGWFEKSGKIQRKGIGGISKRDFPIDIAPDYLWGAAVLYPTNVISNKLLDGIFNTKLPIFFRDDVFINGFITEQVGIERKHMKGVLLFDKTEDQLKTNMIIIYFFDEELREKAWKCYKFGIQCNKRFYLILFQILAIISVSITLCYFICLCVSTTTLYLNLRNELYLWLYGSEYPHKRYMNSSMKIQQKKLAVQWLINLRRMIPQMFIITLILATLFYLVKEQ